MDIQKRKTAAVLLSVFSNVTLVVLKMAVGVIIGSVSVISEAIHSGMDLLASIIAWFAVRTSDLPADEDHPFGHGKIENISGTLEAFLIFCAAAWIVYEAAHKIMHPKPIESAGWGVILMLFSALVNTYVSARLFRVGGETESIALQADAHHLRTDVYTSIGVTLGLALIWAGKRLAPGLNLYWIDPAAAIIVALLISRTAYRLTLESTRDLMDVTLPKSEQEWIEDCVRKLSPKAKGFHHLRTRKSGSRRFIQFHVMVNADMSVEESHELNDEIVAAIKERFENSAVVIHIEPCHHDCSPECVKNCLLEEEDRQREFDGK